MEMQRYNGGAVAMQQPQNLGQMSSFRDKIETIKQTVAKGATDAQLEMFMTLCERYSLDPFLKEIWFVPQAGIITSRDGYLKIAQRDPDFDGIVSATVCDGDHFEMDPMAPTVRHSFGAKRGPIIGAYGVVFHKKRRPALCFASLNEYKKSSGSWSTYTSAMICKVAEVMALKRQFGISGLVTEEEIGHGEPVAPSPAEVLRSKLEEAKAAGAVVDVDAEVKKRNPPKVSYDMLQAFGKCKKAFKDLGKPEMYYEILKAHGPKPHGFASSKDIPSVVEGRLVYNEMQIAIQTEQARVAHPEAFEPEPEPDDSLVNALQASLMDVKLKRGSSAYQE